MNELTKKKISRGALRTHCKKIEGNADDLISKFTPDKRTQLQSLRLNYATQIEKIKAVDQEILTFITDEKEYANELESSLENNDVFYDTLAKIDYCLTERTSSSSKFPFPMSASPVQEQVKLPKIELPKFNGDISKWQTFWDQFESAVHNQVNLSDVDKFSYLRSLLNASASECISGLALTLGREEGV